MIAGRDLRKGMSLPEALVVFGVIGLLIGLTFPAVMKSRSAALRLQCQDRLRGIGVAMAGFHGDEGRFPPYRYERRGEPLIPITRLSWMVHILPFLEKDRLWRDSKQAIQTERDSRLNPPHVGFQTVVREYVCPEDGRLSRPLLDFENRTAAYASYVGSFGTAEFTGGRFGALGSKMSEITDGTSHTILAGERPPPGNLRAGWWYPGDWWYDDRGPNGYLVMFVNLVHRHPDKCGDSIGFGPGRLSNPCDALHYWSLHGGGANFVFCDGSARFLKYSAQPLIKALASRDGGETVDFPD